MLLSNTAYDNCSQQRVIWPESSNPATHHCPGLSPCLLYHSLTFTSLLWSLKPAVTCTYCMLCFCFSFSIVYYNSTLILNFNFSPSNFFCFQYMLLNSLVSFSYFLVWKCGVYVCAHTCAHTCSAHTVLSYLRT